MNPSHGAGQIPLDRLNRVRFNAAELERYLDMLDMMSEKFGGIVFHYQDDIEKSWLPGNYVKIVETYQLTRFLKISIEQLLPTNQDHQATEDRP